jgi:hypothetical protein
VPTKKGKIIIKAKRTKKEVVIAIKAYKNFCCSLVLECELLGLNEINTVNGKAVNQKKYTAVLNGANHMIKISEAL